MHNAPYQPITCEPDELLAEVRRIARQGTDTRSPVSVSLIRQTMYRSSAVPNSLQAYKSKSLGVFHTSLAEGSEGVAAFLDKREQQFIDVSALPAFYPGGPDGI